MSAKANLKLDDKLKAEDLDTSSEDHAADEWRYAAMSRPWREKPQTSTVVHTDMWGRQKKAAGNWKTA